jgi:hypothetical protein
MRPQTLFEQHGIPYYLKMDIEGNDIEVVCHCTTSQNVPDTYL